MLTQSIKMPHSIYSALAEKRHVMTAVMLRDMRTRFFDHGLGFLVVILWPLAHMVILLAIYTLTGRTAPYGDSVPVFFATGLIPTLAFMYVSRFMSLSLILNKPMMSFPIVNALNIMTARAFLEIIAAAMTLLVMYIILTCIGDQPIPNNIVDALLAYLASLFLGVGIGVLASVLVLMMNFFATAYALLMILVYISSGTVFSAPALPYYVIKILAWNPVFQCVEWMRVAFFASYTSRVLSREYVMIFALSSLGLGLALERFSRRKLLEG